MLFSPLCFISFDQGLVYVPSYIVFYISPSESRFFLISYLQTRSKVITFSMYGNCNNKKDEGKAVPGSKIAGKAVGKKIAQTPRRGWVETGNCGSLSSLFLPFFEISLFRCSPAFFPSSALTESLAQAR